MKLDAARHPAETLREPPASLTGLLPIQLPVAWLAASLLEKRWMKPSSRPVPANSQGMYTSLDYLGENVATVDDAQRAP